MPLQTYLPIVIQTENNRSEEVFYLKWCPGETLS